MALVEESVTQINNAQYKELTIQEIGYPTFYDEVNGNLLIIYNEQIIQNNLLREEINNIAKNIREVIKKYTKYNLWNTYFLILKFWAPVISREGSRGEDKRGMT